MIKSNLLILWYCTIAVAFAGCATTHNLNTQSNTDQLVGMNSDLSRSMIVDKDKSLFEKIAVDSFLVLAPGGLVENKESVINGLKAWDVKDIKISGENVVFHDNLATVTSRLDIDGTMKPVGRWGPLKSMRVFQYENNEWSLISQALTPCLPKAVEFGLC